MASSRPSTIVVDMGALAANTDLIATLATLARLALAARRRGQAVALRDPPRELLELRALMGLDEVLGLEPGGQAEEREQGLGLEEEGELDDPPAR
ncbi:MAG: STAS domain-containing protein [Solirubrobacteraceae bacterium]